MNSGGDSEDLLNYKNKIETKRNMAKVLIKTTEGDIKVRLYDETPQHRDTPRPSRGLRIQHL